MSIVTERFDVTVAGAGPGGSAAAVRCAKNGLKTLLLEKRRLPRDKVCTGMVMGPWASDIIREEFGDIPREVLTHPAKLSGHMIHVPGIRSQIIEHRTPMAWRKDLDFWMNQKAADAGAEIRDKTRVVGVSQDKWGSVLTLLDQNGRKELKSRFLIGADGATSVVRRFLFPKLRVRYSSPIRECYGGSLEIERDYCHWFFPKSLPRPRFDINHKGDFFLIEGSGIRELRAEIRQTLADHGFSGSDEPLWRDGCAIAVLHNELSALTFSPARGNIILVGDAAGLIFPITYEGIGPALKSGLLAADAIIEAAGRGKEAGDIYLDKLAPLLLQLRRLHKLETSMNAAAPDGAIELAEGLKAAYESTLKVV